MPDVKLRRQFHDAVAVDASDGVVVVVVAVIITMCGIVERPVRLRMHCVVTG
jgi:hypothetical protein